MTDAGLRVALVGNGKAEAHAGRQRLKQGERNLEVVSVRNVYVEKDA